MAGPAFPRSDRARGALNPEYPVRVFYRLLGVWQTPRWPSTHVDLARPCFLCVGQHQGHYAVCGSANMANFPGLAGASLGPIFPYYGTYTVDEAAANTYTTKIEGSSAPGLVPAAVGATAGP